MEQFIAVSPALRSAFDRGATAFENGTRLRENPFNWAANGEPLGSHLNTAWGDGWLERQAEMVAAGKRSMAG